ncbi:excinuclease ATPase subunit [Alteromonas sp. 1_MG-2023]|uniref:excinuclease ATPase subunit n=1 Tax=Alteromonas sp. 1_MG-2023 TaxID=3062669 RepID=UPI0026E21002|nr:excinuclease ATPase subunit [Alteromonas sp. 1_MG-2023]MDO6566977.1 excinuclease ATPase subunit [Alteromonas sp. 1_MG-2023]
MKAIKIIVGLSLILMASNTFARDTKYMYSIEDALASANFQDRLDPNIPLFFGEQTHGEVEKRLGSYPTNKKTNAFNKTDEEACEWVLLSALLTLQERAVKEGGNAVINIASYYKKNTVVSDTEYECHAGAFVAGVALMGEVVKLAD